MQKIIENNKAKINKEGKTENRDKLIIAVEKDLKRKNKTIKQIDGNILFQIVDNIIIFDNENIDIDYKNKGSEINE